MILLKQVAFESKDLTPSNKGDTRAVGLLSRGVLIHRRDRFGITEGEIQWLKHYISPQVQLRSHDNLFQKDASNLLYTLFSDPSTESFDRMLAVCNFLKLGGFCPLVSSKHDVRTVNDKTIKKLNFPMASVMAWSVPFSEGMLASVAHQEVTDLISRMNEFLNNDFKNLDDFISAGYAHAIYPTLYKREVDKSDQTIKLRGLNALDIAKFHKNDEAVAKLTKALSEIV